MPANNLEIPDLKKKREEREKGAGASWSSLGSGARTASRVASIASRGTQSRGFVFAVSKFIASPTGVLATTAFVAGVSILSQWDMNQQAGDRSMGASAAFEQSDAAEAPRFANLRSPRGSEGVQAPGNGDSLGYLARGNAGLDSEGGAPIPSEASRPSALTQVQDMAAGPNWDGAAAQGQPHANFGKNFGQLSTQLGNKSSLSGGAGMSGGVGRNFGRGFDKAAQGPAPGALSSITNFARLSSAVRRTPVLSRGRSGAMGQLQGAAARSNTGMSSGGAEAAKNFSTSAFEGSSPIGASGAAIGGNGTGGGSANGLDGGAPIANETKTSKPPQADSPAQGQNQTPWQGMIYAAMGLLALGGLLLMIASQLKGPLAVMRKPLAIAAAAAGAGAVALGVMLITKHHQTMQGALFAASGAMISAMAILVAAGDDKSNADKAVMNKAGEMTKAPDGMPGANNGVNPAGIRGGLEPQPGYEDGIAGPATTNPAESVLPAHPEGTIPQYNNLTGQWELTNADGQTVATLQPDASDVGHWQAPDLGTPPQDAFGMSSEPTMKWPANIPGSSGMTYNNQTGMFEALDSSGATRVPVQLNNETGLFEALDGKGNVVGIQGDTGKWIPLNGCAEGTVCGGSISNATVGEPVWKDIFTGETRLTGTPSPLPPVSQPQLEYSLLQDVPKNPLETTPGKILGDTVAKQNFELNGRMPPDTEI